MTTTQPIPISMGEEDDGLLDQAEEDSADSPQSTDHAISTSSTSLSSRKRHVPFISPTDRSVKKKRLA